MTEFVTFSDGSRGVINGSLASAGPGGVVEVLLDSGKRVFVQLSALESHAEGGHRIAMEPSYFDDETLAGDTMMDEMLLEEVLIDGEDMDASGAAASETVVIPLVEETLSVGKREVDVATVRLSKGVTERQETVDEPLARTEVDVRHVEVGRFVDAAPAVRQEGDTMIIPILEEVLVVEKRLRLVEEVHVTQRRTEYRAPQTVTLRKETLSEERTALPDIPGR